MNWLTEIEQTVTGLGYILVEAERESGGMLRVFIEHPNGVPAITVEDCERVTRQLQFVLEVAGVDYQRLEVSSAGLDRPLKRKEDFDRFVGTIIDVTFKQPIEVQRGGKPYQQKKFTGCLAKSDDNQYDWMLVVGDDASESKKNNTKKAIRKDSAALVVGFTLSEVREAKLVPIVNFRGKKEVVSTDSDGQATIED